MNILLSSVKFKAKFLHFLFAILVLTGNAEKSFCQNKIADSIKATIETELNDSLRQISRIRYAQSVKYQREFAEPVLLAGIEEMKAAHNFRFLGDLNHSIGIMYANCGETENAITSFETSLNYRVYLKDTIGMASSFLALSNIHRNVGNYEEAVGYALESEKIYQKMQMFDALGRVHNSLAMIFRELNDQQKAFHYLRQGLTESEKSQDLQLKIGIMENIGSVYQDLHNYDSAIYYHREANSLILKTPTNPLNIGASYGNLGLIYLKTGELDSAQVYLETALEYFLKYNYLDGIIEAYSSLGELWKLKGNFSKAINTYKRGEAHALKSSLSPHLVAIYKGLGDAYFEIGDYKNSSAYLKQYVALRDSVFGFEQAVEVQKREISVQFQKKALADSLKSIERERIREIEIEKSEQVNAEKMARQKQLLLLSSAAIVLFLFFSFFLVRSNSKQKKLNQIIHEQKSKVEEKNREITDSINYARRIQEAILPTENLIFRYFPNSFVFYQPKDIVAGDFYWLEQKGDWRFIAVADCTGHGVPGAMVSVVCANALNKTVNEFGISDPGKILDKVRENVIANFEKGNHNVKDGMDISLCAINFNTNELCWAGANNPLWIVRQQGENGSPELIEFQPDRQPVAKYDWQVPFTTRIFELQSDDCLYMFTDGYADQFGGISGKKYKLKKLKEKIRNLKSTRMRDQLAELSADFEEWKGAYDQVDDVCVIGLRI